ncbi:MAG: LCP family protein [Clostridiaceae bacterium]|nr:LCP family protein [Clostridiaceae bacterium]
MKKTQGSTNRNTHPNAIRRQVKASPARPRYENELIETDFDEYDVQDRRKTIKNQYHANDNTASLGTRVFAWIFTIAFLVLTALLLYVLYRFNILPNTMRIIIAVILLVINVIFFSMTIAGRRRGAFAKTAIALALIFSLILGLGNYYIIRGVTTVEDMGKKGNIRTTDMAIVVLKESPLNTLNDLAEITIQAPIISDGTNITSYLTDINKRTSIDLSDNTEDVETYLDAAGNLLDEETAAMVLNNAWLETILDDYPTFNERTRVIDTSNFIREVEEVVKDVDTSKTGFNVYISGIDTYGPVSTVSRSDVNIIMTMNPNTHKLLLTTIPRDTYLPIAGGGNNEYDKLTHAGIYGVESSIETLENFLETDINYYARVNFSSLIKIVDEIGGIDVDNPVSFSTDYYSFPAGTLHLNGDEALAFSRERHNLSGGDYDRGRNQECVILAIFDKVTSPELLKNYNSILESVSDSIQTNMPTEAIMGIANGMIENPQPWDTCMIDVAGTGQPGLNSYLIPGREIFMMAPYPESVEAAQNSIKTVLEGGPLPEQ